MTDDPVIARGAPDVAPPPADLAPDALEIETLIEGTGEGAAVGDQVTVHYVLVLADGAVVDESWSRGEPFSVTLGEGSVIPGWEQGLIGAKAGERRRLVMGSDLAYGRNGAGPIPPSASLAFEVDIIAISP
ncbi:MAG TPA: FKBP-type peptidyl-prolyl cis-trans isomerase [Acidimicrobiales bacterium]